VRTLRGLEQRGGVEPPHPTEVAHRAVADAMAGG